MTEARSQFSELINRVGFGKERIVLTRHGKPLVALVPAEMLQQDSSEPARTLTSAHDLAALSAADQQQNYPIAAEHRGSELA